ncbi:MAG: DNA primase [Xanthomonadales bacterium]|nr:DNA primase [Xanthomonadales bacterium]
MAGLIPDSFIEELLARSDVVELIERRVPLKRVGSEFQACCPFHDEKTPSFTVSPKKQFYHCFGCGAHGSVIGFLMQFEGLEFLDAVEELARAAGMEIPTTGSRQPAPDTGLYDILAACSKFYIEQLKNHPAAIEYLKGRGLSGEVSRDFDVGYAPAGWDGVIKHLGTDARKLEQLKQAGMLSEGKSGSYDKFRDRIMFPIHDRRGRVIAFGGRALADDGPKYLNSPETTLYHKSRELYGLYLARQRSGRLDNIIVVEGYMDVVALAQFGFKNVVATSGTATTDTQVEILFRAADTIVFCFDGDKAGIKAAWRALEATLPKLREGLQAKFLFLPDGEDPDSMVRKHGEADFAQHIENAKPLSEFFFDHFTADISLGSLDGRARLVQQALPYIERMQTGVFKDMMTARLESLAQHRLQGQQPVKPTSPDRGGTRGKPIQKRTSMRVALAHLVQNPALVEVVGNMDDIAGLGNDDIHGVEIFIELVDFCAKRPNITTAQLVELWYDHPALAHLQKLAVWDLPGEEEIQLQEFSDAVNRIRLSWVEIMLSRVTNIIEQRVEYRALQQQRQDLKKQLDGNQP